MAKTAILTDGKSPVSIGKIGHGLMMMTWKPVRDSDDGFFESIKASLDSVPPGCKMFINSGEFYGINPPEANLELVARFFEKYPSYVDKAFLSVKGGVDLKNRKPDSSPENLKKSVDNILAKLRGTKKLDLFQCARVDKQYPIEETIKILSGYVAEGKFDYIGMSECSAETLRRGYAAHPIAAVEIEVSPWSYDENVKKVLETSKELGVIVAAYSPLGRGFLTGRIKPETLDPNDWRLRMERMQPDKFKQNIAMLDGLIAIAARKNITPAQLCLAWVSSLGATVVPIPGSSAAKRTTENLEANNVELTQSESAEIIRIIDENPVVGGRYFQGSDEDNHLWG